MDAESIKAEMAKVEWFHRIDLGHGIVTPGLDQSVEKAAQCGLPASFAGKSVMDIGAWNGAFSFEAERRGASRVLATDYFCWNGPGPNGKPGFDLAKRALGSKVEEKEISVEEISVDTVGTFDVVLFLGVFYHLPDPIRVLPNLAAVTKETLIVETLLDLNFLNVPAMSYFGGIGGERVTAKFAPNEAFMVKALKDLGFGRVDVFDTFGYGLIDGRATCRGVFHAHK
ncbi:class I SAM-dependent methyltransferase [Azorhizobium doebereinerae]|uniref:class I SAM-dependent methyltransferase n=1 Tax=Azorhizobium doebereinerae TaxID=281091 RepID=UPI0004001230|nr:methyltransferase domain-containing protein [Azorhizobium doebereinerae]